MLRAREASTGGWRRTVWNGADARAYSRALEISTYVGVVARTISASLPKTTSLLDIGAGDGRFAEALTLPGARVCAIEPSSAMRALLRRRLAGKRRLTIHDAPWWRFPEHRHDLGFAANIGAFKADPVGIFTRMRRSCERMAWVVPAQEGPSSFCLSGLVADWLPRSSGEPVYREVLRLLGPRRAPCRMFMRDWVFARSFRDAAAAAAAVTAWLRQAGADVPQAEIDRRVENRGSCDAWGRVTLSCPKRSAILLWDRR